jgi:hypothetical protein
MTALPVVTAFRHPADTMAQTARGVTGGGG